MALTMWTPARRPAHIAFLFWIILGIFTSRVVGQEMTFRLQDELNDVIVFEKETNVELVCEVSGFSNGQSSRVEIRHETFGLITSGGPTSISGNFTVETAGNTTILTIKEISDLTGGRYTCTLVDSASNSDLAIAVYDLAVTPRFMSPQCYSPMISERGRQIPQGEAFSADCIYEDIGTSVARWVRIDSDGGQSDVTSDNFDVGEKFRRRVHVPSLSEAETGVVYKCILTTMLGAIPIPEKDCLVGPLNVTLVTSTIVQTTTLATSATTTPRPTTTATSPTTPPPTTTSRSSTIITVAWSTTKPSSGGQEATTLFGLEGILLYIVLAAVGGAVILLIILGVCCICCCCCSRRSGGKPPESHLENGKSPPGEEVNDNPVPDYEKMPYQSRHDNLYYDSPPSSGVENQGYVNLAETADPNRNSGIILGPEDMASTHL